MRYVESSSIDFETRSQNSQVLKVCDYGFSVQECEKQQGPVAFTQAATLILRF